MSCWLGMKGRAVSEGEKLVPRLRFPEFGNGSDWRLRRLGEFLTESRLAGSKGDVAKKITVKLWGNGVFEKNEAILGSVNTQYFQRKAGQFIYSKLDFLNQAFGVIPAHLDDFESTVDLPCFDVSAELNPAFLLEYVSRKEFYEKVGEAADGSRKAKRVHTETFLSFSAALPSSAEQKQIADCLSSLDELIAAQARKVDALKSHKKGLMQQLFPREGETQPRLRFPEFLNAGEWEINELGELCKSIASGKDKNDLEGSFDLYGSTGVIGKASKATFDGAYILVARVGANAGFLNKANGKFGLTDNTLAIDLQRTDQLDFVYYYLQKIGLNKFVFGSGQPLITGTQLKELAVSFPSYKEQQRIGDCLTSLDRFLTAATQELDTLKTHKKGLMQQIFPSAEALEA